MNELSPVVKLLNEVATVAKSMLSGFTTILWELAVTTSSMFPLLTKPSPATISPGVLN